MIEISRECLERIVKEEWTEASPYTGEYHMGKADLANELLGNPEIDWDKHPRSLENMMKRKGFGPSTKEIGKMEIKFRSSTPKVKTDG